MIDTQHIIPILLLVWGDYMISYEPFWETMKRKNITSYTLVNKHKVSNGTLTRMRKNNPMSTNTLDDLCNILDCEVQDIVIHKKSVKGISETTLDTIK